MKQIEIFIFILFCSFTLNAQNASITGLVVDSKTNDALSKVKVLDQKTGNYVFSKSNGTFNFDKLSAGDYKITFSLNDYDDYNATITLKDNDKYDFGKVLLVSKIDIINDDIAVVDETDFDDGQSEEAVSTLLHGSNDIFVSTAGYTLGPLRFRMRGYKSKYSEVTINGIPMQNMESNFISWSTWGGLNNVTRNSYTSNGLTESEYGFGGVGGLTNISMRASEYRAGTSATYSSLNKAYRNRAMFTYSTGLSNDWAFTFSGSRRWAEEGYVEGTFYDAWAYFASLERKINNSNSLNFVIFASPNRRGKQASSTQEAYDLLDNNYYNPNWGYQNGEKRNSKISNFNQPVALLTHYLNLNDKTTVTTTLSYKFGRGGNTSLNWYNARDPRPDYYRNLPSYLTATDAEKEFLTNEFKTNPKYNQIDWDELYQVNYQNYDEIENANNSGTTLTGNRSEYIVEERRNDEKVLGGNSTLVSQVNDKFKFIFGLQYMSSQVHNYLTVNDLLGGDFFVDYDKYAERDLATSINDEVIYNDIRFPNRIVKEGDIYGYDYIANTNKAKTWTQLEYALNHFEFFVSAFGSYTTFWRTGNMQNGKFPDISLGDAPKNNFIDYGSKGGILYKINGRNYINVHAGYMTNAPTFRDAYLSPRTRNSVQEDMVSEKIMSFDGSYTIRAPRLKASITAYYTEMKDGTENLSFYHDGYKNFVNYVMTGIDTKYQGIEFGMEAALTTTISFSGIASLGYYRYTSRPTINIYIDNSATTLVTDRTVYQTGFLIPGTPQTAFSAGLKYRTTKYWFYSIDANYIDDSYLSINADRRTSEALEGVEFESEQWNSIVDQELLPSGLTINASIGYSIRIKYKYTLLLNFSVENALDNKEIITGGFEQLRFDDLNKNPDKFPAKYFYAFGRTYYLNTSFRF